MDAVLEIAELLEPLNAADSRAFIRARVGKDSARSPAELLHPILFSSDFERGEYDLLEIPRTVEALAAVLDELPVTADQMVPFLVQTCTTDLAYPGVSKGPWSIDSAQAVLDR